MYNKLINILIRHKEGRDAELQRCLDTIWNQTYDNIRMIISDEETDWNHDERLRLRKIKVPHQHYNLHCNDLKEQVNDGWFFYLDDDDYLASPTVLEELSHHLFEGALIVQFLRNNRTVKPTATMMMEKVIKRGMIGGGCLVLHHSFKDVADWKGKPAADYDWIKDVADQVPTRFVPLVLQHTDNNGRHGK